MTRSSILAPVVGILINLHTASEERKGQGTWPCPCWRCVLTCFSLGMPTHDVIDVLLETEQFTMEALDYVSTLPWRDGTIALPRIEEVLTPISPFLRASG